MDVNTFDLQHAHGWHKRPRLAASTINYTFATSFGMKNRSEAVLTKFYDNEAHYSQTLETYA
jgi:hypothetical protein